MAAARALQAAIILAVGYGAPAAACTVPTWYRDLTPSRLAPAAILVGLVVNEVPATGSARAHIVVEDVPFGTYEGRTYEVYFSSGSPGDCPSRGPRLGRGERVAVYLGRRSGGPLYPELWLPAEEAARLDARLLRRK